MVNSYIDYPKNDIIVDSPQQSGDFGLTSYMTYRVYTESKRTEVRRRFNDFAWLQSTLYALYPGILIPPIPSKENKLFVEHKDDTFVNMRMRAFQRFLNRINSHPTLRESADFQTFLCGPEKAFEAKKKVAVKSPLDNDGFGSGFSIGSLFGGDTASVSMESNKEKEKAKNYLIGLEAKLNVLGMTARKMINLKTAYCAELENMELALQQLGTGEPEHIKQPLDLLSESMPEQRLFLEAEVKTEIEGFYELIVDWGRMVHASQELIDSQDLAAKKVSQANKSLKQAREKQTKMSSNTSQMGKISAAEEAVTQATQDVDVANDTLKHIKESMEEELQRFQQHKSFDFRDMLVKYCNANLIYHEQMAAKWRELFPEVDQLSIPETG